VKLLLSVPGIVKGRLTVYEAEGIAHVETKALGPYPDD
jgi:hypothetical protein